MAAAKEKVFVWQGTNKHNNEEKGEITSSSISMAKAMLRKQGITPKKIKKKSQSSFSLGDKPIKAADVAVFSRQLATMIKAGVPMLQSFDITAEGVEKPKMRALILDIKNEISAGSSFSNALTKHPKEFDNLFCSLVATGESSGTLDMMLERIATYKEKSEALKAKIKKAMTYPIVVLVFAAVVTAILLIKVVPQFAQTFAQGGKELPAPTQFVMVLSEFAQAYWYFILGAIIALIFGLKQAAQRSEGVRNLIDSTILKLPVVGEIVEEAIIARFCRTLATTFSAGVPVVEALNSVSRAAGNHLYEKAIIRVRDEVVGGRQLFDSIRSTNMFPSRVSQMVSIGEESGTLDSMLDKVATYYEETVDNKVDNLTTLIEPMIMGFLAIVVGGLMIAMYMPMFQLGDAI